MTYCDTRHATHMMLLCESLETVRRYDQFMNMVLDDAEEVVSSSEVM